MNIKQLQQNGEAFAPQTVAEAVIIHHGNTVKTLDKVIALKIESVESEDLTITQSGPKVTIIHANNIAPSSELKPMQISYDSHGHITEASPINPIIISVNGNKCVEYDGSQQSTLNLGDDFENTNDNIKIRWNTLN